MKLAIPVEIQIIEFLKENPNKNSFEIAKNLNLIVPDICSRLYMLFVEGKIGREPNYLERKDYFRPRAVFRYFLK